MVLPTVELCATCSPAPWCRPLSAAQGPAGQVFGVRGHAARGARGHQEPAEQEPSQQHGAALHGAGLRPAHGLAGGRDRGNLPQRPGHSAHLRVQVGVR